MFVALVAISLVSASNLAGVKNETPSTKLPKLQCLNPVHGSPKLEASNDIGTDKCIAIPDKSKPSRKVVK